MDSFSLYPLMMDMTDKRCLIVGGGRVATRKTRGLLAACATVRIVSPQLTEDLERLAAKGAVEVVRRPYAAGDIEGAALVFAATNDADVNRTISMDAAARAIPVNVADNPGAGTFHVPAVLRQGRLLVAVSTSGASPAAAVHIRDYIEAAIGDGIDAFLEYAEQVRLRIRERVSDRDRRRQLLIELFSAESLAAARQGDFSALRSRMEAELGPWPE